MVALSGVALVRIVGGRGPGGDRLLGALGPLRLAERLGSVERLLLGLRGQRPPQAGLSLGTLGHAAVEAGRDDGDPDLVAERVVDHGAEDDVGLGVHGLGDQRGRLVDLEQPEVRAAGDREQHAVRAVDAGLEQRAGHGHLGGGDRPVLAGAEPMPIRAEPASAITDLTSAKSRLIRPGVVIRSVMPETPWSRTWSACLKASSTETLRSLIESSRSLGMTMRVSTSSRSWAMPSSAELARRRPSNANGRVTTPMVSAPERPGDPGHDGRAAGAGAATLAGGHEHHVGALDHLFDLVGVVLGGPRADLRVGAGTQTAGELPPDVELDVGVAHQQRLRIGVDGDELDAPEADLDHPVDGVDAATADADDLDDREVVLRCSHGPGPLPALCFPDGTTFP